MNELISIDNLQSEQDRFANAIIESKGVSADSLGVTPGSIPQSAKKLKLEPGVAKRV
jgi:hypothetical protein